MGVKESLNELKEKLQGCKGCPLCSTRTNLVFSDGNPEAKIMLIGEAPGADEDRLGVPFVGRAGKLLDEFFKKAGIERQKDVYICNTLKCRPPNNRKPEIDEKKACAPYLKFQMDTIKPKIIILCGATALESFIKGYTITKARGKIFKGSKGTVFIPIFHPSYLLRNHSLEAGSPRDLMLKDLKMIKQLSMQETIVHNAEA